MSSQQQQQTSLFGLGATPNPSSGTSIFGQQAQQQSASLFGFGATPNASSGNSIFSQQQPQQQSTSLFGQQQPTSLFGQQQPQQQSTSLFGQQQPTSLFGQQQTQQPQQQTQQPPQQQQQQASLFGFGATPNSSSGTSIFSRQQPQQQPTSLFGQQQPQQQSTSLFGQQQPQQQSTSLFGQQQPISLFGQQQSQQQSQQQPPQQPQQQQLQLQPQQQTLQAQQQQQQTQLPTQLQQQTQQQQTQQQQTQQQQAQQQQAQQQQTHQQQALQQTQKQQQTEQQQQQQPPQPQTMTFRQLEDNVNTWLTELTQLEQDFREQARDIDTREALLVPINNKILQINQKAEELKVENSKLDRALDFIVEQQGEIERLLEPLERIPDNTTHGERETTYHMVETVQNELHSLSDDLQNFIVKLNDVRSHENSSDPIHQIEQVLNAQMDTLQYVERHVNNLSKASLT